MSTKELGQFGEEKARAYLKNKGYRILDYNFKRKWGELDIVAEKKGKLIFVEVKTIQQKLGFYPEDQVDWRKERQLRKMARLYLSEKKISPDSDYQIDVLAINISPDGCVADIRHFENAIEDQ